MEDLEIEYIDSLAQGSSFNEDEVCRTEASNWRFSNLLGAIGWLIVAVAIVVAVGLAIAYQPPHGDPMRSPPNSYVGERGVPPAADLLLGTLGVVAGLGLVALSRLLVQTASVAARLTVIERLVAEQHHEHHNRQEVADTIDQPPPRN